MNDYENDEVSRKSVRKRALSAARKRCGFTQDRFAEALGVDLSTVGRWERSTQDPQPYWYPAIARVLKMRVEDVCVIFAITIDTTISPPRTTPDDNGCACGRWRGSMAARPAIRGIESTSTGQDSTDTPFVEGGGGREAAGR